MGDKPLVRFEGLHNHFAAKNVLTEIDFAVDSSRVVCVIGPSGSVLRCQAAILAVEGVRAMFEASETRTSADADDGLAVNLEAPQSLAGDPGAGRFREGSRGISGRSAGYVRVR